MIRPDFRIFERPRCPIQDDVPCGLEWEEPISNVAPSNQPFTAALSAAVDEGTTLRK
jgi:hypothetical protein